jgi:hypothetical protein
MKLLPGMAWEITIEMVSHKEVDFIVHVRRGSDRLEIHRKRLKAKKGEALEALEARAWARLIKSGDKQLEELGLATVGNAVFGAECVEPVGVGPRDDDRGPAGEAR